MLFSFEVDGDVLVRRRILRVGENAVDARPAFVEIADYWRETERQLFETTGASAARPWKPIKAATVFAKQQAILRGQATYLKTLHLTGRLRDSLTQRSHPDQRFLATDSFLLFGSELDYAGIHQRQGLRRPVDFSEAQKRTTIRILQRFLITGEVRR